MSLEALKQVRGYLISSNEVTNLVSTNNIKVGWVKTSDEFPCITINQVGGTDIGYLGYGTSNLGDKLREETCTFQIDVYSQKDRLETEQISDQVTLRMISGSCRKDNDIEDYIDELGVYRKILNYSFIKHHDD